MNSIIRDFKQHIVCSKIDTIWPEILAGIYFGRLMNLLHMAKFTLVVGRALCHNDIHSKMANPEQARARLQ